jgi:ribosomal protein S18 acetylase RimI-like enzyme
MRGQGVGKRLIEMLFKATQQSRSYDEYSLFVYRDNEPAYRCYLAMGFVLREYPDDAPMKEDCYFLTRSAGLDKVWQT